MNIVRGVIPPPPPFLDQPPSFLRFPPFLEIQDGPTFHRSLRKTKVLNNSCILPNFISFLPSKYLSFRRMFTKVVKCKPDITLLNVF